MAVQGHILFENTQALPECRSLAHKAVPERALQSPASWLATCRPEHYITWRRPSSPRPSPVAEPPAQGGSGDKARQQGRVTLGAGVTESLASPGRGGGISPVSGGRCLRPRPLRRLRPCALPAPPPGRDSRGRGKGPPRRGHVGSPSPALQLSLRGEDPWAPGCGRAGTRQDCGARGFRSCPGAESFAPVLKVSQLHRTNKWQEIQVGRQSWT